MSAPARKPPILLVMVSSCLSWGASFAHLEAEAIEAVTTGEPVEFSRAPAPQERPLDEDWDEWLEALEVLRHGSRDEKRALFDEVAYGVTPLYGLDFPPGDDETETRRALDELAVLVAAEDDHWVVERIGASLAEEEIDGAFGIFEALTRHRVPAVRARAVEYAIIEEYARLLPTLEAMWGIERVPIVRVRLLEALSAMGSEVHVDTCPELLDHADYDLASAAIQCVGWEVDPEGARRLLERAGRGEAGLRVQALESLETQVRDLGERTPDDLVDAAEALWRKGVEEVVEPTLLAVLEILRSPLALEIASERARATGPLLEQALGVIGRASDPSLLPLLEARARDGSLETRVAAVSALQWFEELTPAMDRMLEEALEPSQPQPVRLAALQAMFGTAEAGRQGRQRFVSWLETLAVSDPDDDIRAHAQVAAAAFERGAMSFSILSPGYPVDHALERFELVAPAGVESLRCRRVPGEEPTPDWAARVAAQGAFEPLDRYDDEETTWRLLELEDETPCWIPQSNLRRLGLGEAGREYPVLSTTEIDVPLEEIDSPAFARLEAAGIVEVFDRGETLAGVRRVEEARELLAALCAAEEDDDVPRGAASRTLLCSASP